MKEEAAMPSASDEDDEMSGEAIKNVAGRKRTIDETKLDPEEARKLESRRAYNRQCAAKGKNDTVFCSNSAVGSHHQSYII